MSRPLFIKLRVTAEEKKQFESLARTLGLSLSALIRQRLSGMRIRPIAIQQERNRQLARIGNNLNQLARWANTHKSGLEAIQIISFLEGIRQALHRESSSTEQEADNVN